MIPFVFALALGAFTFIKNPVFVRNLAKIFFFFEFIFASSILIFYENVESAVFSFNFSLNKTPAIFIFLLSFVYFLFSIISKTFIKKHHRLFYVLSAFLFALSNCLILADNVGVSLISVFWIFLIQYFLFELFSKREKRAYYKIALDIFWLLSGVFLISFDFLRYFIINEIPFEYSSFLQGFSHVSDFSITLAFLGFFIIISRLFNFFPFANNFQTKPFINFFNTVTCLILGSYLLIKIHSIFDYVFYQCQNYIALYLILNLFWFCVLILKQDKVVKFLNESIIISSIISIFPLFSFEQKGSAVFIFSVFSLVISYVFLGFVMLSLCKKFRSDNFSGFKRIDDKNKVDKFITSLALFNVACTPTLAMFSSFITIFLVVFSYDYDTVLLNISPYCLLLAAFGLVYCFFNVIGKIFVEPQEIFKKPLYSNHQMFVFLMLIFVILTLGLLFPQFINYFVGILDVGNF